MCSVVQELIIEYFNIALSIFVHVSYKHLDLGPRSRHKVEEPPLSIYNNTIVRAAYYHVEIHIDNHLFIFFSVDIYIYYTTNMVLKVFKMIK